MTDTPQTAAPVATESRLGSLDTLRGFVTRPERFLNAHWLNPAYVVPLVELSPHAGTATFWSFVAAGYIFLITLTSIPPDNVRFADTVLGFILATVVATILNFFFGSSAGSKAKQDAIESKK